MSSSDDLRDTLGHLLRKKAEIERCPGYTHHYPQHLPRIEGQIKHTKEAIEQAIKAERNGQHYEPENGNKREEIPFIENNPVSEKEQAQTTVGYKSPPKETRFKPGDPGGPGRPKGSTSLRRLVREKLFDEQGAAKPQAQQVVQKLFDLVDEGNISAIRLAVKLGTGRPKPKA